ncbi:uncharacterized protein LOC143465690 isoform X2 [Clavelina lepadiformis]|uniref:uncharacterized protein LOC143465690 isoform X2 n=1 Tax=Clavelina lepadiformis TaxID=159417 RepID=UPI004041CC82
MGQSFGNHSTAAVNGRREEKPKVTFKAETGSMSDSSYRHPSDRDYRSRQRSHHDRDYHRSTEDYTNSRRVPGLVSDPDATLGDANAAIQRGQRETIDRYQSDRYSLRKSKAAKDTMSANYEPRSVLTVSQPYYSRSKDSYYSSTSKRRMLPINPGFLAVIPGFVGFGLLIAAIAIVGWQQTIIFLSASNFRILNTGLFQVCRYDVQPDTIGDTSCQSLENFANAGTEISNLEQATRGMIIIAVIFAFASLGASGIFGCHKFQTGKGALVAGGVYAFAAACAVAAMGCYSKVLTDNIAGTISNPTSSISAGVSFYLGWIGAGCLMMASVISFLGHCARKK